MSNNRETKRLVTDMPGTVGYRDGLDAAYQCGRNSREPELPANQQAEYRRAFRRGAKHGAIDLASEQEDSES